MTYTDIEKEIIVLRAVWDQIHELVNFDIFDKSSPTYEPLFSSQAHRKIFTILLCDFLSTSQQDVFGIGRPQQTARPAFRTFLFYLSEVVQSPKLADDATSILDPVLRFADWLEAEFVFERLWFPSIELETNLTIQRLNMLKICGNIAKHNFARLDRVITAIQDVFSRNGHNLDLGQCYLVLPEFFDWYYDNVCSYHGKTIAEFLNNIRWGMHQYLRIEYERAYEDTGGKRYKYNYPPEVNAPLAKSMYWDLMNDTSREPYFPRFEVLEILKRGY